MEPMQNSIPYEGTLDKGLAQTWDTGLTNAGLGLTIMANA
jgi:hypothetical protein